VAGEDAFDTAPVVDGSFLVFFEGEISESIAVHYQVNEESDALFKKVILESGEKDKKDFVVSDQQGSDEFDTETGEGILLISPSDRVTVGDETKTGREITIRPKVDEKDEGPEPLIIDLLADPSTVPTYQLALATSTMNVNDLQGELLKAEFIQVEEEGFGKLLNDNPDGKRKDDGSHMEASPAFGGGHRFFPGAKLVDGKVQQLGNNIVRIKATLTGIDPDSAKSGRVSVWFKLFDVDDPDWRESIDPNDPD